MRFLYSEKPLMVRFWLINFKLKFSIHAISDKNAGCGSWRHWSLDKMSEIIHRVSWSIRKSHLEFLSVIFINRNWSIENGPLVAFHCISSKLWTGLPRKIFVHAGPADSQGQGWHYSSTIPIRLWLSELVIIGYLWYDWKFSKTLTFIFLFNVF